MSVRTSPMLPPMSNDYSHIEQSVLQFSSPYLKNVSVVIPHYKNLAILENTIASLTLQTYPLELIEVVVADDGSEEDLSHLASMFELYFPVKVLLHKRLGHRVATMRNNAIRVASHEVILSLDCDALCPPGVVAAHLKWFHVSDEVATIGPRRFVDTAGLTHVDVLRDFEAIMDLPDIRSISNTSKSGFADKRGPEFNIIKQHPFPSNCFHGVNVAYTRLRAFQVGLWDESFNGNPNYEDIEFGHRLWTSGAFLVYVPEAQVLHQENQVVTPQQRVCGAAINRQRLFKKIPGLKVFRETLCESSLQALADGRNDAS